MGAAADGKFSADRFVTAYNNMSPQAKVTAFDGNQIATLNDLFTISRHIQDRITHLANPSGTGRTLLSAATLYHLWHSPVTAITQIVGTRMLAKALSHPVIVKAATDVARAELAGDRAAYTAALRHLYFVAARAGFVSAANTLRQNPQPTRQ